MRIERLGLVRFGVFTDYGLDWSAPGLHLVVGRNAAGKSTIRVAVAELLYGIHHRSSYATLHDLPKLTLEATIRGSDGSQLEIVRHKRNKDPLTTGDGAALAESDFLARHLGGIGREEFAKTFAIDHDELKYGSAKLLESGGDLALALFDSRSGAHLTDAFARLDERADELYKKGGTKPRLNSRIAAYVEAKKELKDAVHRPAEWRRLTEIAEEAAARLTQLESELTGARRELERLTRLRDAIPALHLRTRLHAERAALATRGPVVLDETADTLQAIVKRLDAARDTRAHAQIRLQGRTKDLDGVDVDETLLSHAHGVQTLLAQAHAAEQAEKQAVAAARRAAELTGQAERALARQARREPA